ncbi:hypothetical protein BGM21_01275 [Geobacillus thermoleovorans]|uniref:Uncharacterized protein n=1 Tax=Geobacillus thermoleovorans TaxID=33941 RepID=A0A2Z3N7Z2_GEOTH|nr:hypothetical protein BGM21_01275 [Geobacillus thermoleovorans]AWO74074.1 hypothetical protein C1N76_05580 [Geobacillus thermoleovorans]EQB97222.1 hypothetical protein GA8_02185 [Geobacillus sp. A8]
MNIKDIHETQSMEKPYNTENDEIFSSIEDLQNIVSGGKLKRNSFNFKTSPKWVKYLGYFVVASIILIPLILLILNLFM